MSGRTLEVEIFSEFQHVSVLQSVLREVPHPFLVEAT
jgi:hypothetical protein